jgi:hypothetical protein
MSSSAIISIRSKARYTSLSLPFSFRIPESERELVRRLSEVVGGEVGVAHRGVDVGVAEEGLDGGESDPGHHQVGGVGMAEHMDGEVLLDPGLPDNFLAADIEIRIVNDERIVS